MTVAKTPAIDALSGAGGQPSPSRLGRLLRFEKSGLLLGFVALVLLIGVPNPELFQLGSIKTLLRPSAFVGIIAFGMVFLVAMIEIGLSVGGIYAVSATATALLIKAGLDPWLAVFLGLAVGALLGALNGALTVLLELPPIIVSLGTISVYVGLNLIISGANGAGKSTLVKVLAGVMGPDAGELRLDGRALALRRC